MAKRAYLVGHYQYNDMHRPATAVERAEYLDSLPPTMFEVVTIWASNKREAVRLFRQVPQYCAHGRKR